MKKILFLILVFCTQNGYSQFMRMFNYTTAPTGACQFSYMAQNTTDGTLYYCRNGVWTVFTTPDVTAIVGAEPRIKLNETDQTTDEKNWDFDVNSKVFSIRTRTDADGAGIAALTITRSTGTALSDIVFPIISSSGLIKSTSGDIRSGASGINASYQFTGTNNWDIFHNDASDILQFRRNSSQLAIIGPTGKFGIGSGIPGYYLDITQSSTSTASGTYPGIKISNTSTTTASLSDIQILGNNGSVSFGIVVDALSSVYGTGAFLITNSNHNLNFWTNNTARMQIAASGLVGIGPNTPTQDFDVVKSVSGGIVTNAVRNTSNTASSNALFYAEVAGSSANDPYSLYSIVGVQNWVFGVDNSDSDKFKISASAALGTSDAFTITAGGTATLTGPTFMPGLTTSGSTQTAYICRSAGNELIADSTTCLVSAEAFKRDIQPINSGLDLILKLKPITFYYKEPLDDNQAIQQFGFNANHVAEIEPRLVTYSNDGKIRGFRYENYTAILTKAIQELEERVNILEKR